MWNDKLDFKPLIETNPNQNTVQNSTQCVIQLEYNNSNLFILNEKEKPVSVCVF